MKHLLKFAHWSVRHRRWLVLIALAACLVGGSVILVRALQVRDAVVKRPQLTSATRAAAVVPQLAAPGLSVQLAPKTTAPAWTAGGFGISAAGALPALSNAALNARLDDYWALGFRWLRFDLAWSDIQAEGAASYNWSDYDRVIGAAHARGFQLLAMAAYTPSWARPSGCETDKCAPANPADYARFVAAAASRYGSQGLYNFEIWNEENMAPFFRPTATPTGYTHLLQAAYVSLKQVSSSNVVIVGGLGSTDTEGGNIAQLDYMNELYAAGAHGYFDAVAYHPYSFPVLPSYAASWNAWVKMAAPTGSLRAIMLAHGDGTKAIWATEYGAPTGGPGVGATSGDLALDRAPDHVDEPLQAAMATDAIRLWRSYLWAGPLFWYSYIDRGTDQTSSENFYGLKRADGSLKPAYNAIKAALSQH